MSVYIYSFVLPEKKMLYALTYIKGVGLSLSEKILLGCEIKFDLKPSQLNEGEVNKIREYIEGNGIVVGSDLDREVSQNIKLKKDIGCYEGVRHKWGLPVRGGRTKTNARTRKGKKKAPVAGKKKPTK